MTDMRYNFDYKFNQYVQFAELSASIGTHVLSALRVKNTDRQTGALAAFDYSSLIYVSLVKIIRSNQQKVFDFISVLNLSRSILETSNCIFFYFIENVQDEEKEFRLSLFNYISAKQRFDLAKKMNVPKGKLNKWQLTNEDIQHQRSRIENSNFFKHLVEEKIVTDFNCLINEDDKKNLYLRKFKIYERRGLNISLYNWFYKMCSMYLHASPGAIDRQIQSYINPDLANFDPIPEIIEVMEIATSFQCVNIISVIEMFNEIDFNIPDDMNQLVLEYGTSIYDK
jgi:hypothetical protein